jgi:LPS export ABC transporter protein LptC
MRQKKRISSLTYAVFLLCASCTFDYGQGGGSESNEPDIVMENVEYVRVRSAEPQVRFFAERAERYEGRQIMEIMNFSFEQFGQDRYEINAAGSAGSASVEIDTGNIRLGDSVRIEVESEDIVIETNQLRWDDKTRTLSSGESDEVNVYRSDGTRFTGVGFRADTRRQTWEFLKGVSGLYVYNDDENED